MSDKKILILEDERAIASTLEHTLVKEKFVVNHFETIAEAEKAISETKYDLLILDIGLPDGSGLDFCQTVRKTNSVPIFFLTAKSEEIDKVLGLELGADDYISKPFSPRELIARVKSLFRRLEKLDESVKSKKLGDFEIVEESFQIFFKGKPLVLSRYEYGILLYLIESKGRVLSRAQIMEKIWESPEMSLERTIDAHIKSIRKKLKAIAEEEVITTHRGFGYSI